MSSGGRVNMFFNRMLGRSNEELPEVKESIQSPSSDESSTKIDSARSFWLKKLGACSPTKYRFPSKSLRPTTLKDLDSKRRRSMPASLTQSRVSIPSNMSFEMPDLEKIIREFEKGYMSPTKHDPSSPAMRQGNFVKKIVAAFEVKYKAYNELKCEQELAEQEQLNEPTTSKKKSGIFKFSSENPKNSDESKSEKKYSSEKLRKSTSRMSGIFNLNFKGSDDETDVSETSILLNTTYTIREKDIDGTLERKTSEDSCYATPVQVSDDLSLDENENAIASSSFIEDNESTSLIYSSPFKSMHDEAVSIVSVDLSTTGPDLDETIRAENEDEVEDSKIFADFKPSPRRSLFDSLTRSKRKNSTDTTPKVVGAFLKEPIEVENTSIDWIPVPGIKLPRKRSLKKLLSVITKRRKKKQTISPKETRELQDSGYDDKSSSSSSLESLISITDILLQQENDYVEPEKRASTLRTFRPRRSLNQNELFEEFSKRKEPQPKLLLTEVRREELKLDLGPTYPPSNIATMSLDRRSLSKRPDSPPPISKLPKHPLLSTQLPKHPYVSMTKLDVENKSPDETTDETKDPVEDIQDPRDWKETEVKGEKCESFEEISCRTIRNDLYEVEIRRSPDNLRASPSGSVYDVPRTYLSKSEPEFVGFLRHPEKEEPIYDVPKPIKPGRPRSTEYDDRFWFENRLAFQSIGQQNSSTLSCKDVRYAKAKPPQIRPYRSQDILKRYDSHPRLIEKKYCF